MRAVLRRSVAPEALGAALRGVARHDLLVIDPAFWSAREAASGAASELGERLPTLELRQPLTERELEVLGLMAEGHSNRDIAHALGISENTAKFHVNALFAKLEAASRTEAVVRAIRLGLPRPAKVDAFEHQRTTASPIRADRHALGRA